MVQIPCRIRGRCMAFRESPRIVGLHEVVLMQADIAFLDIFVIFVSFLFNVRRDHRRQVLDMDGRKRDHAHLPYIVHQDCL